MIIAIHQPNFLPWIGYFQKISAVDKFVFLDDAQLPRGKSFCSRTKILINGKESWLTIPILGKSELLLIKDVIVNNNINWKSKHLKTLTLNYKKTKYFDDIFMILEDVYDQKFSHLLVDYNIPLIIKIAKYLNLRTEFLRSSEFSTINSKTGLEKIIEINKVLNADIYLSGSGKGSKRYIDAEYFKKENINLLWREFKCPNYSQLSNHFIPNLSIIDLLFNCGPGSKDYFV